jgi:wyosine [tRNA(Phe)-imidazoG37] synthetase (radical SAM superfamily)
MKYIYGPVQSRRLGNSLGITLTPYKFCSLDCVYCQLGPTQNKTSIRDKYIELSEILKELRQFLSTNKEKIDYITFSGFGEPMLNINIGQLIGEIRKISNAKIALITNSTLLLDESVRQEILGLDLIVPSLDAASQKVFEKIDKPVVGIKIEEVINSLVLLRRAFKNRIWLEIMLVKGLNDSKEELTSLKDAVEKINPDKVQLNSPVRAPKDFKFEALSKKKLEEIKEFFGNKAEIV